MIQPMMQPMIHPRIQPILLFLWDFWCFRTTETGKETSVTTRFHKWIPSHATRRFAIIEAGATAPATTARTCSSIFYLYCPNLFLQRLGPTSHCKTFNITPDFPYVRWVRNIRNSHLTVSCAHFRDEAATIPDGHLGKGVAQSVETLGLTIIWHAFQGWIKKASGSHFQKINFGMTIPGIDGTKTAAGTTQMGWSIPYRCCVRWMLSEVRVSRAICFVLEYQFTYSECVYNIIYNRFQHSRKRQVL